VMVVAVLEKGRVGQERSLRMHVHRRVGRVHRGRMLGHVGGG
jgi:hypothetical protein